MQSLRRASPGISILYVEDDPVSRDLVCTMVPKKFPGARIFSAENGQVGLELFKEHRPDIVLTDISMPAMDGIRMAGEIRALHSNAQIIVVTAHSDTHYLLDAIKIGISRYVLKPIDQKMLFEAIEDCVARIALERQVKEQDEFIRKLSRAVEQSPSTVVITDTAGAIEYVNPKFTRLTGYTPEEAKGKNPRILKTGATPPETYKKLWSAVSSGFEWHGEFLNRKKGGELYWEAASISPIFNGEGDITHFVAVKEDITERKRIESELRAANEKLNTVLGSITDAYFSLDSEWRFLEISPVAERMIFQRPSCELLGKVYWEEYPQVIDTAFYQQYHLAMGEGRPVHFEGRSGIIDKWFETHAYPRNGRLEIYVRDITERKRVMEEIEKLNTDLASRAIELETANLELGALNKELDAFSHTVSHDLRSPLTNIHGSCQVIMEFWNDALDDQCKKFVRNIYDETERMGQLITALMDFSRMSRIELHQETVDLSGMAKEIVATLQFNHPERKVAFSIVDGMVVNGDVRLLRVVLDNLLGNAWKYTGKRESAEIEFGTCGHNGKPVFFIRDNGIGFDMGQVDRLFGAFKRLHEDKEFKGHGIGLATVQRIIQRHNGDVWAEGEVGQGATFYFTLSEG